jgi:translation elongation factor EF-1alpha
MAQNGTRATGPRCIALVGPFQSGKTTLLEAILARTGTIARQGSVDAGNTVADASKEARSHRMSVELSVASAEFMGDSYTFIDCPGCRRWTRRSWYASSTRRRFPSCSSSCASWKSRKFRAFCS